MRPAARRSIRPGGLAQLRARKQTAAAMIAVVVASGLAGCAAPPAPPSARPSGPYVRVLGTVQDGGLPHPGCSCERCEAARHDPARRRYVASLAVVLPSSGRVVLVDAGPDLREQLHDLAVALAAAGVREAPASRVDRAPVDGVVLTHAHVGHYLGLAFFGFEAVHTRALPVWATPRMAAFLRGNGPWSQLVAKEEIAISEIEPGSGFDLGEGVAVRLLAVPHRDEYSDTVGVLLRGPQTTLLYVPDTEPWRTWPRPLPDLLAAEGVDVALLDGTFYSPDELPGRPVSSIGHPLMTDTLDLLAPAVAAGQFRVLFTHLNHSNPALDPASEAARAIKDHGFSIAAEGEEISL